MRIQDSEWLAPKSSGTLQDTSISVQYKKHLSNGMSATKDQNKTVLPKALHQLLLIDACASVCVCVCDPGSLGLKGKTALLSFCRSFQSVPRDGKQWEIPSVSEPQLNIGPKCWPLPSANLCTLIQSVQDSMAFLERHHCHPGIHAEWETKSVQKAFFSLPLGSLCSKDR